MTEDLFILVAGALLASTLVAALVADRLRLPALVLFLGIGMAAGSDGAGWIRFEDYDTARRIGTFALALILFEGGLGTSFDELRPLLRPCIGLAVVGTLVTALTTGMAATVLLGLSPLYGLLLGSILASTDGAAVFAILRGSSLRRTIVRTLEGEAGLNDPVAVLLVVGFTRWIQQPGFGLLDMGVLLVVELSVGAAAGIAVGRATVWCLRRMRLATGGLYPVGTFAAGAVAFGAAESLHGSGFLAVYLVGLTVGSSAAPAQVTIAIFHQGAAWLGQVALFLTLGLLVAPSRLAAIWLPASLLALFIVFVARPLAVLAGTALERCTPGERGVLSWAGLRGGVPVVLATFPVIAGVEGSRSFFDVVFFAVLFSTLLQGMTFEWVAQTLGVSVHEPGAARVAQHPPVARPWSVYDGDPAHPVRLDDVPVVEHLRRRTDQPGALVALADGRHAITGTTLTVGHAPQLRRYAEERAARAADDAERAWWRRLGGALPVPAPR
jgi:potassium/hydrogen antiporter